MVKQNFRNQRGLSPFFGPPKIFNYAKFGFFCCTRCGRLCAELGTKILNWIGPDNDNFMHYAWPRGPGNTDIWTMHHGPRARTKDQGHRPQFERQRQPLSHWSIQKLDNFVHRPPATNMRLPCSGANEWTPRISGSGLGSGAPRKPLPPEPTKRASLCSSFIFSLRGHPPGGSEVYGGMTVDWWRYVVQIFTKMYQTFRCTSSMVLATRSALHHPALPDRSCGMCAGVAADGWMAQQPPFPRPFTISAVQTIEQMHVRGLSLLQRAILLCKIYDKNTLINK